MKTQPRKAMTFRELKEFCDTLNEEQLNCKVLASGEERGFDIQVAEPLEEDYFVDDYCMNPVSVYDADDNDNLPLEESGYPIIKKGTPYLYFDMWEVVKNSETYDPSYDLPGGHPGV